MTIPANVPTPTDPEKPETPPRGTSGVTPQPSSPPAAVAAQANRYFTAVYGPDWVYKAPEQFPNLVEQWIWALAASDLNLAEYVMTRLETMAVEAKG